MLCFRILEYVKQDRRGSDLKKLRARNNINGLNRPFE
jgi:hypothetical protein